MVESPDADYGFRLATSRENLSAFLAAQVDALGYPNFKSEVAKTEAARAHVYMDVWTALHKLRGGPPMKASRALPRSLTPSGKRR